MVAETVKTGKKKKRAAWGITGSGDRLLEVFDVMQEVRKKLDAVEFPFTSLFQSNPQFRTYFMRITRAMTAISEFFEKESNPTLVKRIEAVVSRSADELETILKTINSG